MITALGHLGRWILRRPDVSVGAVPLHARRGTLAVPMVFAVLCAGEIVLLHLLIPWPAVRVIADLAGVAGLVAVLGLAAAPAVHPHLLFPDRLELRVGGHQAATVPRELVGAAHAQRRLHPTAAELTEHALTLPGPDGTNVTLRLTESIPVSLPPLPGKRPRPGRVQEVRLHLDEPEALLSRLPTSPRSTSPPGLSGSVVPQRRL